MLMLINGVICGASLVMVWINASSNQSPDKRGWWAIGWSIVAIMNAIAVTCYVYPVFKIMLRMKIRGFYL